MASTGGIMFKDYQSKPVVRSAYEITEDDLIVSIDQSTSFLRCNDPVRRVTFRHYEDVKVGDSTYRIIAA